MISKLVLNEGIIEKIKTEVVSRICELMGEDIVEIILYGSCARGDYSDDSDIDIALLTRSDRMKAKKYNNGLAAIATDMAMKYFAVVNFVCLPFDEYMEKVSWYEYFRNIRGRNTVWIKNIMHL